MMRNKLYSIFILCIMLMGCASSAQKSMIEFRFVFDKSGNNRTEYILDNEKLYADSHIVLSLVDIESAIPEKEFPFPESYIEQCKAKGIDLPLEGYRITMKFTEKSSKKLFSITEKNIGKRLGIFIGGKLIMAPKILESIPEGVVSVSGNFTKEEVEELANKINKAINLKK